MGDSPSHHAAWRILDANANRASEGLRVAEEYARFVLDDPHLTRLLKELRHDLAAVLKQIPPEWRTAARATRDDVGTQIATPAESRRADPAGVAAAGFQRVEQSLRALEEYGKIVAPFAAAEFEQLRYRTYTLEKAALATARALERLAGARLYVLIDGGKDLDELTRRCEALVSAGVHVLQLRDKRLDDRTLLERARALRKIAAGSETLFIMNDRADLAYLAQADGVHVGQEELPVKDARAIVGPKALVGVSAHSLEQARAAVLDGADYLGVGPTFPSATKEFATFPGLELLEAVSREIRLPAFAIGGVSLDNVPQVKEAGFTRIAVNAAVNGAADPAVAVREFLKLLE
jgi:thiamine-phosphate pyrophosphorylase